MNHPLPKLQLGAQSAGTTEMQTFLEAAIAAHAAGNLKRTATALKAAELAAKKAHLSRQAAQIRKALTLLAKGHSPRLITRPGYLRGNA